MIIVSVYITHIYDLIKKFKLFFLENINYDFRNYYGMNISYYINKKITYCNQTKIKIFKSSVHSLNS